MVRRGSAALVAMVLGVAAGCGSGGPGCPSDLGMRDVVRPDIGLDAAGRDPVPGLDTACLFFPQDLPAPDRTVVTVGRIIGDLVFATFPGEAVTQIGVDLRDEISQLSGGLDVAFFGYSQDYTGYSTPEWDWWQGGYEAAGAIWGPKQGDYLKARILDAARWFFDPGTPLPCRSR